MGSDLSSLSKVIMMMKINKDKVTDASGEWSVFGGNFLCL